MTEPRFIPYSDYIEYPPDEMRQRAADFNTNLQRRRTVREFSNRYVPREIIEDCIRAAGSAPSGANMQPWHFVVVSDPEIKARIRDAAEKEEREFYAKRAPQDWLDALEPLGTDWRKPFLETAPYLIAIFVQRYGVTPDYPDGIRTLTMFDPADACFPLYACTMNEYVAPGRAP